jgi:hypothetical protein
VLVSSLRKSRRAWLFYTEVLRSSRRISPAENKNAWTPGRGGESRHRIEFVGTVHKSFSSAQHKAGQAHGAFG